MPVLKVEVVVTPQEKQQGLSHRQSIDSDRGMLFVYEDYLEELMLDESRMNFATDVLWIKDDRVVDVLTDIQPAKWPIKFESREPFNYFLELKGGVVNELGLKIGDPVMLP